MLSTYPNNLPPLTDTATCIVVGSGIAGLSLALKLSQRYSVIIVTKSTLEQSNTNYAQGGIASALEPYDSPELHYQDTIMAGAGLCDSQAVLSLVYDGPERVRELIKLGVPFDRNANNKISMSREAAHSRRRILHADGDATGREIAKTLIQQVKENPNITIYENHFVLSLVSQADRCCGIIALHHGQTKLILGGAVALCTGGIGQIYSSTTNPFVATGDGMALAYNAGAALQDMEFLQFHPTALSLAGAPPFLISEAVRGEGAILLNRTGHRFMPEYHPLAELAPRDVVARSIFAEIQKGASPVYLDLSQIEPATVRTRFPNIYETCLNYGLDISVNPIPVAPAAHYVMGGVATDLFGRTNLPGLFAAGETACTGVHGANRLASNSLLEGLVFGNQIAEYIIKHPVSISEAITDLQTYYPPLYTEATNLDKSLARLHHLTDNYLGIVRDQSGLTTAQQLLKEQTGNHQGFSWDPAFFELQNMYGLASLMFQAALTRTESRGGHYRSDYPDPQNTWQKHIIFINSRMEVK